MDETGGYFFLLVQFSSSLGAPLAWPIPLKSQILADDVTGFIGRDALEVARHPTRQQS